MEVDHRYCSTCPSINAFLRPDGNYVAFESHATDLASGEAKAGMGVYLYEVETGMAKNCLSSGRGAGVQGLSKQSGPAMEPAR